jgi:SAM-dependent methyltransferase
MRARDFRRYRADFTRAQREVLALGGSDALNEAAFPAYATSPWPARFLFWQRVRRVMEFLEARAPIGAVLDFGCGGGVMLPFLGGVAGRVAAVDRELGPLREMRRRLTFPPGLEVRDAADGLPEGPFDFVLALDVLEHVDDLAGTLRQLLEVMAPGGEIVVSGPTENLLYRLGRGISGPEYSGSYHVRSVHQIRRSMEQVMPVSPLATVYPLVPLFRIVRGHNLPL